MLQLFNHVNNCQSIKNNSEFKQLYIKNISDSYKNYSGILDYFSKITIYNIKLFIDSIQLKFDNNWNTQKILDYYDIYNDLARYLLDNYTFNIPSTFLFKYGQEQCYDNFKKVFDKDKYWGLLIAPTGWGKSFMHVLFIAYFWSKFPNKNVLLLSKRKDILADQINDFKDRFDLLKNNKYCGNFDIEFVNQVTKFNEKVINKQSTNKKLIIVNTDKLIFRNNNDPENNDINKERLDKINWNNIGFVIFDEVHWSGSDKIYEIMKYIKGKVNYCIGSSATPVRENYDNQQNIKNLFPPSFDNDNYEILYNLSYLDAWKNNVIVPIKHEYFIVSDFDEHTDGKRRFVFNKKGKSIIKNKLISYHKNNSLYGKIICYCDSRTSLVDWYNVFYKSSYFNKCQLFASFTFDDKIKNHIKKNKLSNSLTKENCQDNGEGIQDFKKCNNNAILFVVYRACEGFDDPKTDIICNLDYAQTRTAVMLFQKIGRAQRIYQGKQIGYYISPIPATENSKDEILDTLSKLLFDYFNSVLSKNNGDKTANTTEVKELIDSFININNCFNIDHTDICKRIEEIRIKSMNEITVSKAMKIIKKYKQDNDINEIESEEEYKKICDLVGGLPKDPKLQFGNNFPGWIEYLGIDKSKYYDDIDVVKKVINKIFIDNMHELYEYCDNSYYIYEFCINIDNKIPPFLIDFYNINSITEVTPKFK